MQRLRKQVVIAIIREYSGRVITPNEVKAIYEARTKWPAPSRMTIRAYIKEVGGEMMKRGIWYVPKMRPYHLEVTDDVEQSA